MHTNRTVVLLSTSILLVCLATFLAFSGELSVTAQPGGYPLDSILFYITTSKFDNSSTDDDVSIFVSFYYGSLEFNAPNENWDENEWGRTERYVFSVQNVPFLVTSEQLDVTDVCIRIDGGDAWLIKDVVIVGITDQGDYALMGHSNFNLQFSGALPRQESNFGIWLSSDRNDRNSYPGIHLDGTPC